jgi:hypothetical protein
MLSLDELEAALRLGHETRGFELKGPGLPEKPFLAKVVRAALSMGNLRDGGFVVIGIDDANPEAMLPGLSEDQLAAWLDYDTVASRMAEYADPPLRFDVAPFTLSSGASAAVLEVHEFSDVPHLCAKSLEPTLREGALYVRPRKMPQTAEIPSSTEMREVLDLAAEKRLRAFVESADRAGVRLSVAPTKAEEEAAEQSSERFGAQLNAAWDE